MVSGGSTHALTHWYVNSNVDSIILGTGNVNWTQITSSFGVAHVAGDDVVTFSVSDGEITAALSSGSGRFAVDGYYQRITEQTRLS